MDSQSRSHSGVFENKSFVDLATARPDKAKATSTSPNRQLRDFLNAPNGPNGPKIPTTSLNEVLISSELRRRPSRPPNHQAEAEAFVHLSGRLSDFPSSILQSISEDALRLCGADSAGISILELEDGREIFRWRAVAGTLAPFLQNLMPRNFSPCAVVFETSMPQLMANPVRHFTYLGLLGVPILELLMVPIRVAGQICGTLWVATQNMNRKFDGEDLRVLTSLAKFSSAAYLTQHSLEETKKARQFKADFLANISHEVRTPLGVVLGFADLLQDKNLTPSERRHYLELLSRNGKNLSVLFGDILDLFQAENGGFRLEWGKVHPKNILDDVMARLRPGATAKGLSFDFAWNSHAPAAIVTDGGRLRQILMDLIENAVKFTSAGSVLVRGFGFTSPLGQSGLGFEIADTGIGIPESKKDDVFEMFAQANSALSRVYGGAGLGLALARRIARLLGGDVTLKQSILGKGSSFILTIVDQSHELAGARPAPRTEAAPVAVSSLLDEAINGIRALVVDDSADNQQLIWHCLHTRGAIVEFANDGLEGCRKALAGDYDVVLMDIQMPGMDGCAATRALREAGYARPIIALTANARADIRQLALDAGCTAHMTKPLHLKELIGTIHKCVNGAVHQFDSRMTTSSH